MGKRSLETDREGLEKARCSENAGEKSSGRGVYTRIQGGLKEPWSLALNLTLNL